MISTFLVVFSFLTMPHRCHAELIPLFHAELPERVFPGYETSVNHSPSFYVWQNDPGFTEYLHHGLTGLCIPSSISNMLLYQYARQAPRLDKLLLEGLSEDRKSVETTALVRGFMHRCGFDKNPNTIDFFSAASCLSQLYRDSGYPHQSVRLIRKMDDVGPAAGFEMESRAPTIEDLKTALQEGDDVVAAVAFMAWHPELNQWVKQSSHAINIFGYSMNESESNQKITVYLSNPTRHYQMDGQTPLFDVATFEWNRSLSVNPEPYSPIEIKSLKGSLLSYGDRTTFLAGLLIVKHE